MYPMTVIYQSDRLPDPWTGELVLFVNYIGNYDYYLGEKKYSHLLMLLEMKQMQKMYPIESNSVASTPASDSKLSWQEQKEQQARERKRKNELKKTEEEIANLKIAT